MFSWQMVQMGEEKSALNIRVYDIVLSESSLSFQFPSLFQIAVVSLVSALRCLCSRSLACVTSFPLPVQPMLIITPVFQTTLFPGGICKNFQIHIPIRRSDSADGFSNRTYSRQERKERQNMCWQQNPHSIFSWLLRRPDHSYVHNSDRGIWDWICVCGRRELLRLIEIFWPLSWFAAPEANQITPLASKGPLTSFNLTFFSLP